MRIIEGIVVTDIGDKKVAICTGDAQNTFKGFINLNETAYFIYQGVAKGKSAEEIAEELKKEYQELTYDDALKHTNELIDKLKTKGIIID